MRRYKKLKLKKKVKDVLFIMVSITIIVILGNLMFIDSNSESIEMEEVQIHYLDNGNWYVD